LLRQTALCRTGRFARISHVRCFYVVEMVSMWMMVVVYCEHEPG
jgi:hypothetical protein